MTNLELNIDELIKIVNHRREVCNEYLSQFMEAEHETEAAALDAHRKYEESRERYFASREALHQECTHEENTVILEAMNAERWATAEEIFVKLEATYPPASGIRFKVRRVEAA